MIRLIVLAVLALILVACGSVAADESVEDSNPTATVASDAADDTPPEDTVAAESDADAPAEDAMAADAGVCDDPFEGVSLRFRPDVWTAEQIARYVGTDIVNPELDLETNFCKHSVDYSTILSGGPPPDGIPPIDNPSFDSIAVGDEWLADVQPVIALEVDGEARAYPLAILTRHEIVNDEIAETPVAVTFCPLCNAAVVFERVLDGETLRFGVSGNLRNSDLIMWDNVTLSWWQQFTGEAIVGDATGAQLTMIPAPLVSWGDFKEAFPEGMVLSTSGRSYGTNPYAEYDSTTSPFLFDGNLDPRLPATSRVLGYFSGNEAVAYPLPAIAEERVIMDTLDGREVVIFFEPGQVSALDRSVIEDSKEVGSASMYVTELDGQTLSFSYEDGTIVDDQTDSEWDVFGRAVAGELEGSQLRPVLSHMHFWFAWAAFRPETAIYGG